jgi:hypothetical protein
MASRVGFVLEKEFKAGNFHWGLIFKKIWKKQYQLF